MTSNYKGIIKWFEDNKDDLDFDGDLPEALGKALERIRDHATRNKAAIGGFIDSVVSGFPSEPRDYQQHLSTDIKPSLQSRIFAGEDLDRTQLSTPLINLLDRRDRATELSTEDIQTFHRGRSIATFAKLFNLNPNVAETLLTQKGVPLRNGRIVPLGSEET